MVVGQAGRASGFSRNAASHSLQNGAWLAPCGVRSPTAAGQGQDLTGFPLLKTPETLAPVPPDLHGRPIRPPASSPAKKTSMQPRMDVRQASTKNFAADP